MKLPLLLPLETVRCCDPAQPSAPHQSPPSTPERRQPSSLCRAAPQPHAEQVRKMRRQPPKLPPFAPPRCAVAPDRQATAQVQPSTPPGDYLPLLMRPASPVAATQPENTEPSPRSSARLEQSPATRSVQPLPQWLEPQQQESPGRSPLQSALRLVAYRSFAMELSSAAAPRLPRGSPSVL